MYCPQCGRPGLQSRENHEFRCDCGFHYFHNVAAAVAAILQCGDEILVTRRAREPGKGQLDFPGGFVDPAESLEQALRRELHEELGLEIAGLPCHWLGSASNRYPYDGIRYHTCDSYFHLPLAAKPAILGQDDVAEAFWLPLTELAPTDFAFDSSRQGLALLQARLGLEKAVALG